MADLYAQLLDATIQHLRGLKARGTRFVSVSAGTLEELSRPRPVSPRKAPPPAAVYASAPVASPPPPPRVAGGPVQGSLIDSPAQGAEPPGAVTPAPPALDPVTRAAAFEALRARARACHRCAHLAAARQNVVFGVGNIHAELMFVGEAPGADEDVAGEPFVGKAGQLLTRIIQAMGLTRETVYIANILKCRPDTPGQTAGNRKPTPEEMRTCIGFLQEQIDLIRPKVLVGLGATAVEGLLQKQVFITRLRGQWQTYRGIPLMPTYHPAFLLRNQSIGEKRRVWEDMLQVMERVGMPISEKQRNYFLNA